MSVFFIRESYLYLTNAILPLFHTGSGYSSCFLEKKYPIKSDPMLFLIIGSITLIDAKP